jgi:hypothetical protein
MAGLSGLHRYSVEHQALTPGKLMHLAEAPNQIPVAGLHHDRHVGRE